MKRKILFVEDEPGLQLTLSDRLRSENYEVETASDGVEGYRRAAGGEFDLVILDVMLPEKDGFTVCRDLRQSGMRTPILMLTARGEIIDKVLGLKIGADDYLTKPFEMAELLARLEALLRRSDAAPAGASAACQFGDIRVDFRRTEVLVKGDPVVVSAKEFRLLSYLVEHPGETLSREELLREVWGYKSTSSRTVDVHVAWLRQTLESDPKNPRWIVTVRGLGYKFLG